MEVRELSFPIPAFWWVRTVDRCFSLVGVDCGPLLPPGVYRLWTVAPLCGFGGSYEPDCLSNLCGHSDKLPGSSQRHALARAA